MKNQQEHTEQYWQRQQGKGYFNESHINKRIEHLKTHCQIGGVEFPCENVTDYEEVKTD